MQKTITSSVIICTRNRPDDLRVCLDSIATQTMMPWELIIVDSSDIPLSEQRVFTEYFSSVYFPNITLIYIHTKPELTHQRNMGIMRSTGDVLYFFDDDVKLERNYLECMNSIFIQHSHYGGGMGSVINIFPRASYWQQILRTIFLLQRDYSSGYFIWSGMPTHAYGTKDFRKVEVLGGCCMAYKRALISKYKFDESLGRYAFMEDYDSSKRICQDAPLFYNPDASLYHYNSPLARNSVVDNKAIYIKNYSYLFFKNFYPHQKLCIIGYTWSVIRLFVEILFLRRVDYISGYVRGLRCYFYGEKI